jgi:NAD(P)H-hydrate repair Nnr-like enzyme with NAD(P)H-hydrate dehydratase domain
MTNASNDDNQNLDPNLGKNRYIFAGAGAVLTGVVGAAIAGGAGALVGVLLGGLLGYNMLKRP